MYLDYAGIRVRDLERSLKFYTDALSLQERRRGTMPHGGVWVLLEDRTSHQQLELNWYPEGSKFAVPYSIGEGLDHLGFRLPDVKAGIAELQRAGATLLHSEEEDGVVEAAFLTDPDGLWIELIRTPMD